MFLNLYFVFSVWCYNSLVYQDIFQTKHKILNTKHLMNSTFYEFIIIQNITICKLLKVK